MFFSFNDAATTEIYTLSLHDALPITPPVIMGHSTGGLVTELLLDRGVGAAGIALSPAPVKGVLRLPPALLRARSEEHTSELQSRPYLVCRLLFEKKKQDS